MWARLLKDCDVGPFAKEVGLLSAPHNLYLTM